ESRIAMRGADADPHRKLTDLQRAGAVHAMRIDDREFLARFGDDALALALRQCAVGLVTQPLHFAACVVIAHPTFERHAGTGACVRELARERGGVDWKFAQFEHHYPPDTGGRKTTSSPSCRCCSHGAKAPFTATRSRSSLMANPCRARNSEYKARGSRARESTRSESMPA